MADQCKACEVRGKTWKGQDPKCCFQQGVFDPDGWMCATASKIRNLALKNDGDRIHHHSNEGQHYATISTMGFDVLPYEDGEGMINAQPVGLFVGWYKDRGRTEAMWLMFENDSPRCPTEEECLSILKAYEADGEVPDAIGSLPESRSASRRQLPARLATVLDRLLPVEFGKTELDENIASSKSPYPEQSRCKTVPEDTALQMARVILKTSDDVSQVWDAAVGIGIVIPIGEVSQETKDRFYDSITIIRDIL